MNTIKNSAGFPELDEARSTETGVRMEGEKSGEDQNNSLEEDMSHERRDSEEGGKEWSDISPTKQARSIPRTNEVPQTISSPSRFAIMGEEEDESNNIALEKAEKSEEGEILEDQTLEVSEREVLDTVKCNDQQKQERVDGVNTRRTSTRNTKGQAKNGAETKTQSISNLASAVGKKHTSKKN